MKDRKTGYYWAKLNSEDLIAHYQDDGYFTITGNEMEIEESEFDSIGEHIPFPEKHTPLIVKEGLFSEEELAQIAEDNSKPGSLFVDEEEKGFL
jgi:hypothetical protein